MSNYSKELVTAKQVEDFLKSKKKTRSWFHNLGSRHGLLPPPIIKANHQPVDKKLRRLLPEDIQTKLGTLKGRSVYYPVEIKAYLALIIDLKDAKHLSFERIANDQEVARELTRLTYLVSTCLLVDPLRRDGGSVTNFRVATRFLVERFGVGKDGVLSELLGRIGKEARSNCEKYYELNDEIRSLAIRHHEVDKELEKEKKKLFYSASLSLKIMDATTKTAIEGVRKKEISWQEWLGMADELEPEDKEAGVDR
jgi:hypothetical protein